MKQFDRLGFIGRFKPLQNGSYSALDAICSKANTAIIGIGSANKYDFRCPFTAAESEAMVRAALQAGGHENYLIERIDDYGDRPQYKDGSRWRSEIINRFGALDAFVTGNPYVRELLQGTYTIINPLEIIDKDKRVQLRATNVRRNMVLSDEWRTQVPRAVAQYLEGAGLIARFREEYGTRTLTEPFNERDTLEEERDHVQEGPERFKSAPRVLTARESLFGRVGSR